MKCQQWLGNARMATLAVFIMAGIRLVSPAPGLDMHNIAAQALIETSHDRDVKRGQAELTLDGNPATSWKTGPYSHLVLRYAHPIRLERIVLVFGEGARPPRAYRIEGLVDESWQVFIEVDGNSEARREHPLTNATCSGVRFIPRSLLDAGALSLAEIELWSPGRAQPFAYADNHYKKVVLDRRVGPRKLTGIRVKDHWRDFFPFPVDLPIDGVEYWALWCEVEPEEGQFDWRPVDRALYESRVAGQSATVKFISEMHTPQWLFDQGVPRVLPELAVELRKPYRASFADPYNPPVYWNPTYLAAFSRAVRAFAARYDGCAALGGVHLSLAGMGEMGRFGAIQADAWERSGYRDTVFIDAMKKLIDVYADSFHRTPLVLQISYIAHTHSATPAWVLSEYAAGRGIAIQQNSMDDVWGTCHSPRDSVAGKVTYLDIFRHVQSQTQLSAEMNAGFSYNGATYPPRFPEVLWQSVLNSLGVGVSQITLYQADALQPSALGILRFAKNHLGCNASNTPSAWTSLRGDPLPDPHVGLEHISATGSMAPPSKDFVSNRLCRRTDRASGNARMDFHVEPVFLARQREPLRLRVIYHDHGSGGFRVQYHDEQGNYQSAVTCPREGPPESMGSNGVTLTGSEIWKEACFRIPGLVATLPVHFSIVAEDVDLGVHFVELAAWSVALEWKP